MAQGLGIRAPERLQPSLIRPKFHFSRSIKLAIRAKAANNDEKNLFIFGLGYTGLAAANYFQQRNWHVSGTVRDEEKTDALKIRGFNAYTFHADGYEQLSRPALAALHSATHILSTVPPDGDSDPVLMAHTADLIDAADRLRWVGYISSTSVYGDHGSEWVDEESELLAAHGKGLSRILAEGSWIALCHEYGIPVHVFRCGGIYGPRRSALDALQKEGRPSANQERRGRQKFTARCHVRDICTILQASMRRPRPGAVYNVVDDEPAGRGQVMEYAASLLNGHMASISHEMPRMPSQEPRPMSPPRQREFASGLSSRASIDEEESSHIAVRDRFTDSTIFSSGSGGSSSSSSSGSSEEERIVKEEQVVERLSGGGGRGDGSPREKRAEEREHMSAATPNGEKRVKNDLIKKELGVVLEFPTYRQGLDAIAHGDTRPF